MPGLARRALTGVTKMKHLLLGLALVLVVGVLQAQDAPKVQEPEYINVFFVLNPADGSLLPLERQTGVAKVKLKGLGFGGAAASIQITGERSSVRFKADKQPSFVVKLPSPQTDPASAVQFFSWQAKKGVRSRLIGEAGAMGMSATARSADSSIPFDAARYGESSIKLTPTTPLAPGEYGLGPATTYDSLGLPQNYNAFSFGIDSADANPEPKPK